MVAYGTAGQTSVMIVRCADRSCGQTSAEHAQVAVLADDAWPGLAGLGFDPDGHVIAVLAGKAPESPDGLHLQVGRPAMPRVISVTCGDDRCERRTTRAWNEVSPDGRELFAWPVIMPGGRLAILEEDAQGARLVACEHHCAG